MKPGGFVRAGVIVAVLVAGGVGAGAARADCVVGVVGCSPSPEGPAPKPTTTTTKPPGSVPPPTLPVPITTTTTAPAPSPKTDTAAAERRLLELVNHERTSRGLRPLSRRSDVDAIAVRHSADMAAQNRLWHNASYFTAATKDLLGASFMGENVAKNDLVDDMHRRLMNSPDHRDNILNPRFNQVGLGVVAASNGQLFGTQNFMEAQPGKHAPAPPAPRAVSMGGRPAAAAASPAAAMAAPAGQAASDHGEFAFPMLDMAGPDSLVAQRGGAQTGRSASVLLASAAALALTALAAAAVWLTARRRLAAPSAWPTA